MNPLSESPEPSVPVADGSSHRGDIFATVVGVYAFTAKV